MERTNILGYVLISEKRKKIIARLLEFPKRQWSCSALEEQTCLSHATVFRTLNKLKEHGLLKTTRVNKKDILYDLVEQNPMINEIKRAIDADRIIAKEIAKEFVKSIKYKEILSILLYGSNIKGDLRPDSDIDILVVLEQPSKERSREVYDKAAELSSKTNKTIAVTIMDKKEMKKEKRSQFLLSVKEANEVLYGKNPF